MEYVEYFKRALEQFDRDLKADSVRLSKIYNELDDLGKKRERLAGEVKGLEEKRTGLVSDMKQMQDDGELAFTKRQVEADSILAEAHGLFDVAKKQKKELDDQLIDAKKEYDRARTHREYWEGKANELKSAMGVSV